MMAVAGSTALENVDIIMVFLALGNWGVELRVRSGHSTHSVSYYRELSGEEAKRCCTKAGVLPPVEGVENSLNYSCSFCPAILEQSWPKV